MGGFDYGGKMIYSPMMQQYLQTKDEYKDSILLYRLGDFYEMFFDDAIKASEILDLVLTSKVCGQKCKAPMCGIPYHAVDNYIAKLIEAGEKVAICEQLSEPNSRELVKRGVVRVVTPGTVVENTILNEKNNNYLAVVFSDGKTTAAAYCDITTGRFFAHEFSGESAYKELQENLLSYSPKEILTDSECLQLNERLDVIRVNLIPRLKCYNDGAFTVEKATEVIKEQYKTSFTEVFNLKTHKTALRASGALLSYLNETQKRYLSHLEPIKFIENSEFMSLNVNTRRSLELVSSGRENKKKGSLLWLLDNTKTGMGGRLLCDWVEHPLQNPKKIQRRLDAVEELVENFLLREEISECLQRIKDIERLSGKISYNNLTPRDCNSLQASLAELPVLKRILSETHTPLIKDIDGRLVDVSDVEKLLFSAIKENAPAISRDGNFIKEGYNAQVDYLRNISQNSIGLIGKLEEREKTKTGIKTLKVGYNRVFGYYIEVSNAFKDVLPQGYIRKQTIATGERFVTEELKKLEEEILNADESVLRLEKELFEKLRQQLLTHISEFQSIAQAVAELDALTSLARTAVANNYRKPKLNTHGTELKITEGRHPVVEKFLKNDVFVTNDTCLDTNENRTMIITGPNMAGKSTFMRQVALIVLMTHIGSFVPAKSALVPIVDKIFTRVGANDDLTLNQSTFMVEMVEIAAIMNGATSKSLILLDEVGRGTATFDGLSIAWAIMEHITEKIRAKTLFATHYHELTELEGRLEGVKNYKFSVKELPDGIVFLRKITRGGANKSFGIEVAALAGIDRAVLERASELVSLLEKNDINASVFSKQEADEEAEKKIARERQTKAALKVASTLKEVDMNNLTPLLAFDLVNELSKQIKESYE